MSLITCFDSCPPLYLHTAVCNQCLAWDKLGSLNPEPRTTWKQIGASFPLTHKQSLKCVCCFLTWACRQLLDVQENIELQFPMCMDSSLHGLLPFHQSITRKQLITSSPYSQLCKVIISNCQTVQVTLNTALHTTDTQCSHPASLPHRHEGSILVIV